MNLNRDKLKAAVHYICGSVDDPIKLGATKLNKILWYSDIIAFLKWSNPITGETYEKRQYGPMPSHIYGILEELRQEGKIHISDVGHFGRVKKQYVCLEEPTTEIFNADEISIIDQMISSICDKHTATSISDMTHDAIWEMARIGEPIPYVAVLASALGELNGSDMEWAKREASRFAG